MERRTSSDRRQRRTETRNGTEVFRRILVAIDTSAAARAAFVFVGDLARQFDAQVWFIQLTDESSRRDGARSSPTWAGGGVGWRTSSR